MNSNGNGNAFALATGILGILGIIASASGVLLLAIIAITFLVAFLVALGQNLATLEAGCKEPSLLLNFTLNMLYFGAGSLPFKKVATAITVLVAGWVFSSIVSASAGACKYKVE